MALQDFFTDLFQQQWPILSHLNIHVVKELVKILGITTPLYVASEIGQFPEDPDERLIAITKHFGADTYLAGSGGRNYMDISKYEKNSVKVLFQDYKHPVYSQLFGDFLPYMSVVDLIYNCGGNSLKILRGDS